MGKISAATERQGNQVARNKQASTMVDYVKAMTPAIKKALPRVMTPERFTRITSPLPQGRE